MHVTGKSGTAVGSSTERILRSASPQMSSVEAYIQFEDGLITEDGQVTVPDVEEFLRNYMTEFHKFVIRVSTVLPRTT